MVGIVVCVGTSLAAAVGTGMVGTVGASTSSAACADVGEGTSVGTGMSVGEEGAARGTSPEEMGPEAEAARSGGGTMSSASSTADPGAADTGKAKGTRPLSSAPASPARAAGEVGDGKPAGTGISVGEDGLGPEADAPRGREPEERRGSSSSSGSCASSGATSDVGDGCSVGTGISVGDSAPMNSAEAYAADTNTSSASSLGACLMFTSGSAVGTASSSSSPRTGDVGDGNSVGTGISVGEEGGSPELKAAEPNAAEACPNAEGGLTNSRTCSERERTMDVEPSVGDPGTSTAGASPSSGARDVGEGTSVGTGISVGEEEAGGPEGAISAEAEGPPSGPSAGGIGTTVGTSSGTSVGTSCRLRSRRSRGP
mmetsp:Transcript_80123/g.229980  ORF Transcript_80123/g.229980 Transcript_80123/m.229980 type:complete len:370 (+) Transcript_80123:217-1326(+)